VDVDPGEVDAEDRRDSVDGRRHARRLAAVVEDILIGAVAAARMKVGTGVVVGR
jgi:hypothetical protein